MLATLWFLLIYNCAIGPCQWDQLGAHTSQAECEGYAEAIVGTEGIYRCKARKVRIPEPK